MPNRDRAAQPLVLEHFVPYRLSVLANTVSRTIAREYQARFGLSIPEWRIMAVLGRYAPLAASGVCERTAMHKVRVSRAVSRLLVLGLIERKADPTDGRRGLLRHSRAGAAIYRKIAPLALAREHDLLSALTAAEQDQLDALLGKLQTRAAAIAAAHD